MSASVDPKLQSRLEDEFRRLTELLYDTHIPADRLETEVVPYLADDITFTDPLQFGRGKELYKVGMAGFHAMFRFHFEFFQVNVQLNDGATGGRAIVDGIMHLKQLSWLYVYPLRTLLTYEFTIPDPAQPTRFLITAHEEMWSIGDMVQGVPLVGRIYSKVFRPAFTRGFELASKASIRLRGRLQEIRKS
jgi:hypothetical protein